jgi:DNA-binding transcriptional regulator YdaS (Cro superfamily)
MDVEELARFLAAKRLSQSAFARRIGTSGAVVCRWLSGNRTPSTHFALAIARETKGAVPVKAWERQDSARAIA